MKVEIFALCKEIKKDLAVLDIFKSSDILVAPALPTTLGDGFIIAKVRFDIKEKPAICKITIADPKSNLIFNEEGVISKPENMPFDSFISYIPMSLSGTKLLNYGKHCVTLFIDEMYKAEIYFYCIPHLTMN